MDQGRCSQNPQNENSNIVNVINALENYCSKQALTQSTLNALQEYDGSDKKATIELITGNTGIDPL